MWFQINFHNQAFYLRFDKTFKKIHSLGAR